MNQLGNLVGELCKAILPIPEEVYFGNQNSSVAICTLSSIKLLKELTNSGALEHVSVIGRLLSENKGIDSLIKNTNNNQNLKTIIICGKEVSGHKSGHSLILLHKYGVDANSRIINSQSPDPVLSISKDEVEKFRKKIRLVDLIGQTNIQEILNLI